MLLTQESLENFFEAIKPLVGGFRHQAFSYVGRKTDKGWELLNAKIELSALPGAPPESTVEAGGVVVGRIDFASLGLNLRQAISALSGPGLDMPFGKMMFVEQHRQLTAGYERHQEPQPGERLDTLTIWGGHPQFTPTPQLDWEFRNAPVPYESFSEAIAEHGLAGEHMFGCLRILARQILVFLNTSQIENSEARVRLALSTTANPSHVSLAYRVILPGPTVAERGRIEPERIKWKERDGWNIGEVSLPVPNGALVHCFASYDTCGQQRYIVAGPHSIQNSSRAAYEAFDAGLSNLKQYLGGKGRDKAGDLEAGVANLLSLLGFSVSHLSATRTKEAPDQLVRVPFTGDIALIECTCDTLKGDNKLGKLSARGVAVRERLAAGGLSHLRVLPVIVSSLPRAQLEADVPEAKRLGIVVVDQETLMTALDRTLFLNDPRRIFDDAYKASEEGKKEANRRETAVSSAANHPRGETKLD